MKSSRQFHAPTLLGVYFFLALVSLCCAQSVGYSAYKTCIQQNCFSLATYCQKDTKCTKSYELVNLCSQVNPNMVSVCTENIHNYLHVSLQQCLSQNCNYVNYFQTCGVRYAHIRQCMTDITSSCYLNQGGKQFAESVAVCVTKTEYKQCQQYVNYSEYYNRCAEINMYSCYDQSRENATDTIKELLTCRSNLLIHSLIFILAVVAIVF